MVQELARRRRYLKGKAHSRFENCSFTGVKSSSKACRGNYIAVSYTSDAEAPIIAVFAKVCATGVCILEFEIIFGSTKIVVVIFECSGKATGAASKITLRSNVNNLFELRVVYRSRCRCRSAVCMISKGHES